MFKIYCRRWEREGNGGRKRERERKMRRERKVTFVNHEQCAFFAQTARNGHSELSKIEPFSLTLVVVYFLEYRD